MKTIIVTGSAGLVGSECVRYFCEREFRVVGVDNDMRAMFFGSGASTSATRTRLVCSFPNYEHVNAHIDDLEKRDFEEVDAIIHCAAQPSHDYAADQPALDWHINATSTMDLLNMARNFCPYAAFIFTSTNKVYGDAPNRPRGFTSDRNYDAHRISDIGFEELETRYEPSLDGATSIYGKQSVLRFHGFDETTPIDQSTHSLFGCSKLAADVLVQEYGRYFGMNTVAFRCGCLTGPAHAGAKQHGFLSYLVRCAMTGTPYEIIGYKGKQVRDNLHAADLVRAFDEYLKNPKPGAVYNMGGGRENSCSVIEAIRLVEEISGRKVQTSYTETPRKGDHQWWISDTRKFRRDYPAWSVTRDLPDIITEMVEAWR